MAKTRRSGSYDRNTLLEWRNKYKTTRWGLPCGSKNRVLSLDVDFEKDKDKRADRQPDYGRHKTGMAGYSVILLKTHKALFKAKKPASIFLNGKTDLKISKTDDYRALLLT